MLNISKSIALIILLLITHFYFYDSEYVKKIDYKLYDFTNLFLSEMQEKENETYSVVIDIDEKSVQAFGQWPWSRVIDAKLVNLIDKMSPSAIGVNILFPERDKVSPLVLEEFYKKYFGIKIDFGSLPPELQDNDEILAQVFEGSNVTLPIYLQNRVYPAKHCTQMTYKKNCFVGVETEIKGEGLLCSHEVIQGRIENFGFINAWSDSDGIFRRVPLLMKYKQEVFPSFALATLLSFYKDLDFNRIEEMALVDFSGQKPKVISASDILTGNVSPSDIEGKVVILGSSVVGIGAKHRTSTGEDLSDSMIHAVIVDHLLNDKLLVQPKVYKLINIMFSFFLSLIMLLFLSRKAYFQAVVILLSLGLISVLSLVVMYLNGVYISLGYLWTPFFSFLIFIIIYHVRVMNKEKIEQDKFFIRQNKFASMGEMISLIAHQWRQPLSVINGTVLNLDIDYRKEKLDSKTFDGYLNDIEATTAYLSNTINDFSDFFSKNKQAQPFNLSSVMAQAKQLSAISLSENIKIIYRTSVDIEMNGYPTEIVQSLLILLNNAIYICQKNLETIKEGRIFIDVTKVDKRIIISVEDNAGGVNKKDMKKVFDPYFTTKEQHNGTGLGLYILKLIVEDSMNGKVSLYNAKEGAVFSIKIPRNME